jgi:cyclic pyranopterin phosphate synthase
MTAKEIIKIVEIAKELGIEEVKLTGGEPALREDLEEILGGMPKSLEISMTTNATLLSDRADRLADAGLRRINVDLPTFNEEKYRWITGKHLLKQAMEGLQAAMDAGLKPIKINMVLLNGINVDEVEKMLEFCADNGLVLQLIELLPVNDGLSKFWYDLKPIEKKLEESATRIEQREMHWRKKYVMPRGEVEIVRPMHNSEFCLHCNRLRLTSDGYLKPCLMRNDNLVDVLGALRSGNSERVKEAFLRATELRQPYFADE